MSSKSGRQILSFLTRIRRQDPQDPAGHAAGRLVAVPGREASAVGENVRPAGGLFA